jgi:hypothetical protein
MSACMATLTAGASVIATGLMHNPQKFENDCFSFASKIQQILN